MREHAIEAGILSVTWREYGEPTGWPCIMGHGFPYDVHAYADVGPHLAAHGARVIVPYLRGYGPTQFLSPTTPRSGEQAVLGADLLAFMDALKIDRAVLGGYDWGGRAACIVAALWPERVTALVTGNSYNIQNIARSGEPLPAREEASLWYQYYFHAERGRTGLERNRRDICELLWRMWSPKWSFPAETFALSAAAFDNPDFVDVVIHSYRHRFGLVPGDPAAADIEARLAAQPPISVPTIAIDGDSDGVNPGTAHHRGKFTGPFEYRIFRDAGHNLPQERPADWGDAVLAARALASG
ncbi:MAG TPA: alpha/beta hydrolase [Hyphomicrobiaceae bacterium]|nr:alpha/beta hydrolase [Hyphomicrobiaceae bacterium]